VLWIRNFLSDPYAEIAVLDPELELNLIKKHKKDKFDHLDRCMKAKISFL
jgi:hypothetical protein